VCIDKIKGKSIKRKLWKDTRTLVIDEISMISGELFDYVEAVARGVRGNQLPFGGMQLVICGDFLQLPPVKADKFAFEATSWQRCVPTQVCLTHVFRQNDRRFVDLLNSLRFGRCPRAVVERLWPCRNRNFAAATAADGIEATQLYPHRK
jgi:ATP-dependent DNA helicase PIF1